MLLINRSQCRVCQFLWARARKVWHFDIEDIPGSQITAAYLGCFKGTTCMADHTVIKYLRILKGCVFPRPGRLGPHAWVHTTLPNIFCDIR